MYTRCPKCSTCFRVSDRHLTIANGKVRCGQCQHVFHAPTHAVNDLPLKKNTKTATAKSKTETKSTASNKTSQSIRKNDDHIFDNEIDLNQAIDELTRAADSDFNLDQIKDKETAAKKHQENLSENIFSTDNYDETNANSVEEVMSEMENQLSLEVNSADLKNSNEEINFINLDSEINHIEELSLELSEIPESEDHNATFNKNRKASTSNQKANQHNDTQEDKIDLAEADLAGSVTDGSEAQSPDNIEIPLRLRNDIERLQAPTKRRIHPLVYIFLILLMLLVSALQLTYFRAHEIVSYIPEAQPYLEKTCEKLNCRYSGARDIEKIQLISRDVRVHPEHKKALLISAAMMNSASFAQPYPKVHIRLSDISGNIVAERTFNPETYLGNLNNPFLLMKSKTPVLINFEVVDPGKDAINFEFTFH